MYNYHKPYTHEKPEQNPVNSCVPNNRIEVQMLRNVKENNKGQW